MEETIDMSLRWRERRRRVVTQVISLLEYWFRRYANNRIPSSMGTSERERVREEIMGRILGSETSRNITRMSPQAFINLCNILEKDGGLRPTRLVSVEEQVAKTLYILAHHAKNREIQFWFLRSRETTSCHFHRVLKSIIELEEKMLVQPDGSQIPSEILGSSRYYPYFKVKTHSKINYIFNSCII